VASWSFGEDFPLEPGFELGPPGLLDSTVITVGICGGVVGLFDVDDLPEEVTDGLEDL